MTIAIIGGVPYVRGDCHSPLSRGQRLHVVRLSFRVGTTIALDTNGVFILDY
jgi:hypothetical protein